MIKFSTALGSILLSMAASPALAQGSVPLTDELFEFAWVIVEYEGQIEAPITALPTFYVFDRGDGDLGGATPCGTEWTAKVSIDLPSITVSDVSAFITDGCPAFKNSVALIEALEKVASAKTGLEGLELLAEDGRRLILMVAGG